MQVPACLYTSFHRKSLSSIYQNSFLICRGIMQTVFIVETQTQPTAQFNRVWGYTTFLQRDPPHRPTQNSLLLLLTSQLAGRDLCLQLYSHRPVQPLWTTIVSLWSKPDRGAIGCPPNCRFFNNFELILQSTISPKFTNLQYSDKMRLKYTKSAQKPNIWTTNLQDFGQKKMQ